VAAGVKREKDLGKNGVDCIVVYLDCINDYADDGVDHDKVFPDDQDDESEFDSDSDGDEDSSLDFSGLDDDDDVVDDDDYDPDGDDDVVGMTERNNGSTLAQNACAPKFQAQHKLAVVLRGNNIKVPHQTYERIIEEVEDTYNVEKGKIKINKII
jgi:hypothetical protein